MIRFCKPAALALALSAACAQGTPWVDTQDNYLRQSLQTLSHAGLLSGPVNTYPLMWKNIAADLQAVKGDDYNSEVRFALAHVRHVLQTNKSNKTSGVKLKANSEVAGIQSFGETYPDQAGVTVFNEFQGTVFAGRMEVSYRDLNDTSNEQDLVYDNSYLAALLGNWVVSVDQISNWWGPGQQSNLLLSNNARPIPSLRVSRHGWNAIDAPVLNWLGPWSFSSFVGIGEHSSAVPQTRFWGARFNFRPSAALEVGVSRISQWGGQGRGNDFSDWWDMVLNNDDQQPNSDQRAALDFSYHLHQLPLPVTAYAEIADDDNADGWPENPLLLLGARSYWGDENAIHTVNLEYSDTYIDCDGSTIKGECAYQGELYPQGYSRYGRVIGSGYGQDARVISAGYHYQTFDGISWSAHLYRATYYDEGAGSHSWQLKTEHRRPLLNGLLSLQLRYLQDSPLLVAGGDNLAAAGTWEYRF
ncbi:capsule assembly Wzi family protein [Rheinheimera sp.]|uniref:capsule assembly Wzi family protein n=1 Tax=Rheinheimera sp. TaxID=1869214 RepID=UPI00307ED154